MEVRVTHTVVFQKTFFSKRPEALKSIDMTFPFSKFFPMVNSNMFAIELQRVVGSELIRVKDTSFFSMLYDLIHQFFCRHILYNGRIDSALSLKHTKGLDFLTGTTSSWTFLFPSKIGLITFNLSRQFSVLISQVVKYFKAITHVVISDFMVAPSQIFHCFLDFT